MQDTDKNSPLDDDDDIIDAEIITEEAAPQPGVNPVTDSFPDVEETTDPVNSPAAGPATGTKRRGLMAKLGWALTFLLAAFIGGLFAEPLVEPVLNRLGLMQTRTDTQADPAAATDALQQQLDRQADLIRQLDAAIKTQQSQLATSLEQTAQTSRDLALLAAAPAKTAAGTGDDQSDRLADLQAEIDALRSELVANADEAGTDRVAELAGRLEIAREEAAQLRERLQTFETQISALATGQLDQSPRGRLAMTLGRMARRLDTGQAYSSEVQALKLDLTALPALDQQDAGAALTVLTEHAAGVATHAALIAEFPAMVRAVKQHAAGDGTKGWLASLFVARRTNASATGLDGTLNSVEHQLNGHNLDGVLTNLRALDPALAPAITPWADKVQARRDVLAAHDRLVSLSAGATTSQPPVQASDEVSE